MISKTCGLEVSFAIISSSNYRGVDVKSIYPKNDYNQFVFQLNICFGCIKEMSQGAISFKHTKHIFIDSY